MKAKVCQKVTSKWLEACDFQYCVLQKCQEWYILTVYEMMSVCMEGLFSFFGQCCQCSKNKNGCFMVQITTQENLTFQP